MEGDGLLQKNNDLSPGVEHDPDALVIEDVEEVEPDEDEEIKAIVEDFDDAIKLYLRDIQKTKLLTAEEEKDLAAKIDLGDKVARDRMVVSNLRLVVKIAKRYFHRGMPFLDLIEEGNMGLIKAVERFKLSKECRFATYATWWIRQSIERSLDNNSRTIRLPVNIAGDIKRMFRGMRVLGQKINRKPTIKEVAETLDVDVTYVRRLMVLSRKTYSIEQPMGENNDFFLMDTMEDTSTVSPATLLEDLNQYELVSKGLMTLSQSEQKILTLRFGLADKAPQTLDTIGKSFGVTRERIRQIETKSLEKLRSFVKATAAMDVGHIQ